MKKSLLVLLVLILGACSITSDDENKPTSLPFGEMAQGHYEIDGQELELKADGHFYSGDIIVYTMVEDRGEGKAVYSVNVTSKSSVMTIIQYFGLVIKVTGGTKTLTIYKKSSTEYWDMQSEVSFESEFGQGDSGSIPVGGGEDKPLDPIEAKAFIDKVNKAGLFTLVDSKLVAFPQIPTEGTITLKINNTSKEFKLAHLRNETDAIFTNGIGDNILYVGIAFRGNTLDQQSRKDYDKDYTKDNISWSKSDTALAVVNDATAAQKSAFAKKVNDTELKIVDDKGVFIDFTITPEGTWDTYIIVSVINDTTALVISTGRSIEISQVELRGNEFGRISGDRFEVIAFIPNITDDQKKTFVTKVNAAGLSTEAKGNIVDFIMDENGSFSQGRYSYTLVNLLSDTKAEYASLHNGIVTMELRGDEFGCLFTDDGIEYFYPLAFKKSTPEAIKIFTDKINAEGLVFAKDGDFVKFTIADGTYTVENFGQITTYKIGKIIDDSTVLISYSDAANSGTQTHGLVGSDFGSIYNDNNIPTIGETIAFKKSTPEEIQTFAEKINALLLTTVGSTPTSFTIADGTYTVENSGQITTTYKIGKIIDDSTVLISYSDAVNNSGTQTHGLVGSEYGALDPYNGTMNTVIAEKK